MLGNHDLHLLAAAAGQARQHRGDTFADVLDADDSAELINWLRRRPLLHWDPRNKRALVHAGVPPHWDMATAAEHAGEIEQILRGPDWQTLFGYMYGDEPAMWSPQLPDLFRRRYTINALTRMRFVNSQGALEFCDAGPADDAPPGLIPWFRFPKRRNSETEIIFGHWAALGFRQQNNVVAIDSGCVWGGCLSAYPVSPAGDVIEVSCKG